MMMKRGLIGLAALLLTAAAPLGQGDPIPDREIILEEDPGSLTVSGTTDRSGVVLLSAQPGRYALKLPNSQMLGVPAAARIEVGRSVLTTNTIRPGGRGDAYFTGRDGRRQTIMVPRGSRVRIALTEDASARSPAPPVEADTGSTPEGPAGARADPRIPPPSPRRTSTGE